MEICSFKTTEPKNLMRLRKEKKGETTHGRKYEK